jgi:hypothetical protein
VGDNQISQMMARSAAILVGVSAAVLSASPQTPQTNRAVTSASVRVDLPDSAAPKAVASFALWSDLSWEGSPDERDRLLKQREQRAEPYAFWIAALKDAAGKPPEESMALLRRKHEERRRESPERTDSVMDGNLEGLARLADRDPTAVPRWLDSFRSTLEQQHALLTRHLKR